MSSHRPNWITGMEEPMPVAKVGEYDGSVKCRLKNWDTDEIAAYTAEELDDLILVLGRAKEDIARMKAAIETDSLYSNMIFGEVSDV